MTQTSPATEAGQARLYTLLSLGSRTLLLPQSDIRTLASVQDISLAGQRTSGVVGWLPFAGRRWPVYCLDEALHARPDLPPGQRICALMRLDHGYFGLVCAHVALVQGATLHIRPIPAAMATPDCTGIGLAGQQPRPGEHGRRSGGVAGRTRGHSPNAVGIASTLVFTPSPSGRGQG
jgi:hypothetical protein